MLKFARLGCAAARAAILPLPVAFLLLFLLAGSVIAAGTASGARQCVTDIGLAVDRADAAAALDIFVQRARDPRVAEELPPMLAILFAQAAPGEQGNATVRAVLLSESRAFVMNGISSGAFAGRRVEGRAAQGVLAPLFADASTGRKEVRQVGEARAKNGDWLVPFTVYDHGNGENYRVTGRVRFNDGKARLVAVENLDALMGQVADESRSMQ